MKSPIGYHVTLARDRWREIVRFKHPALAGRERELKNCLEHPKLIRQSSKDATVHLYYSPQGQIHLCVVVAPELEAEYFVVTAYFTKNIKKGIELWTS
ncbi:MAG: DUF4258 domain-containing protein [Pirellulales bacterium]|nr:DUF4258 domain-containing protein [Pirellulales bacterium]